MSATKSSANHPPFSIRWKMMVWQSIPLPSPPLPAWGNIPAKAGGSGTGYSSLETLHAFPFDKMKLDRSFVTDIGTNRHSKMFIRSMLASGKSLAIPVLAEGIETESQMALLTEEGCDQFQGYFLGSPQ